MATKENIFRPLSPKRNSEEIAYQIEESIISKQFKPNDRLPPERELAEQFNAGRGAVREALRRLEGQGFVHVKPGRDGGIFVKELDSSGMTKTLLDLVRIGDVHLQELTVVRILIETKILELCIENLDDDGIAKLEENIKTCEALIKDQKSVFGEHQNFHTLMASLSRNRLLEHFLSAIVEISDTFVKKHSPKWRVIPQSHIKGHKAILKGLKERDIEKAKRALLRHLNAVDGTLNECRKKLLKND
jgi:GntR family transcriptional repressor for pyruvate dehydrogenase complex